MRGNIEKLPKWAQQEIERLDREVEFLKGELSAGPEDSNAFADPYGTPRPLGKDAHIEFQVDDRTKFHVRMVGDALEVMTYGGHGIAVSPRASNVIYCQERDWR